jgi:ABC-type branched-subunit amino acid transport system substrate-binding protein
MTRLVATAIATKGDAPDQVRSYLDTAKDFDGVTGRLSFDSNGDVVKQGVYLFRVVNGKYVKVQ